VHDDGDDGDCNGDCGDDWPQWAMSSQHWHSHQVSHVSLWIGLWIGEHQLSCSIGWLFDGICCSNLLIGNRSFKVEKEKKTEKSIRNKIIVYV
jgi:hypothetical protein